MRSPKSAPSASRSLTVPIASTPNPSPDVEIIPPGAEPPPSIDQYLSDLASGRDDVPRKVSAPPAQRDWVPVFLHTLRNTGNVRHACQKAGISRQTALNYRKRSQKFLRQWDLAIDDFGDMLQGMCLARARTSDLLLMFITKKFLPEYRDNYDARKEASATFWQGSDGSRAMSIQIKWPEKAIDAPANDDDE